MIDAHTHVFGNGPDFDNQILRDSYQYRTLTALANAQKDLMVGFTTLRDLKTLGAMYSDVDLRNAIDRGIVPGPRMQVATRGIQATGGFVMRGYSPEVPLPSALQVVDSPWAGREAVRDQVAHDADLIKVYAAYDFHFTSDGKVSESADLHRGRSQRNCGRGSQEGTQGLLPRVCWRRALATASTPESSPLNMGSISKT